jgi:hypothetical protein
MFQQRAQLCFGEDAAVNGSGIVMIISMSLCLTLVACAL